MSKKSFSGFCKDCGIEFKTSELGNFSNQVLGNGTSSRCALHRKKYRARLQGFGTGYLDVKLAPVLDTEHLNGIKINNHLKSRSVFEFPGIPDEGIKKSFATAELIMRDLIDELLDPNGDRLVMLCLPTGFGKSVYMPYRLLTSKLAEKGAIWVTEPRLSVLRPKKVNGEGTIPAFIGKELLQAPQPHYGKGFEVGVRYKDDNQAMYDADNNRLVFCSDGLLLRMLMSGDLNGVKVLVIDEAHEMSENMSALYSLIKLVLVLYPDLRVVFASATVDPLAWVEFYAPYNVKVIAPQGSSIVHKHPITVHWPFAEDALLSPLENYRETFGYAERLPDFKKISEVNQIPEITSMIIQGIRNGIIGTLGNGYASCLIFVPTQAPLVKTIAALEALALPGLKVFPVYANATPAERSAFYESETRINAGTWPKDWQRIVVATNTLETGVTYSFDYVLEPGLSLRKIWNSRLATYEFNVMPTTRDKRKQRWGRVGRTTEGEVIPYYSKEMFFSQLEFSPPTLANCRLDGVLLSLLRSGLTSIKDVPIFGVNLNDEAIAYEYKRAVRQLRVTGAIDNQGRLTTAGVLLEGSGSGSVNLGAMLLWGEKFGFVAEIASFIAFVNLADTTVLFTKDDKGLLAKHRFASGCLDDLEFYLKLYLFWCQTQSEARQVSRKQSKVVATGKELCQVEGLNDQAFRAVQANQKSLLREFERGTHNTQVTREFDYRRIHRIRASIARAMPEWIFLLDEATATFVPAFPDECLIESGVRIDRSSSCGTLKDLKAFVCIDRAMSANGTLFAKHIVQIEPEWIPLLAAGNERMLQVAVKGSMREHSPFTEGVTDRLLKPPLAAPDLTEYYKGQLLTFTVLQQQPSKSKQGQWMMISIDQQARIIAARMAELRVEPDAVVRAYVTGIDQANATLELSQNSIRQGYISANKLVLGTVVDFLYSAEKQENILGIVVEIEPGVRGYLYADRLGELEVIISGFSLKSEIHVFPSHISGSGKLILKGPRMPEVFNFYEYTNALVKSCLGDVFVDCIDTLGLRYILCDSVGLEVLYVIPCVWNDITLLRSDEGVVIGLLDQPAEVGNIVEISYYEIIGDGPVLNLETLNGPQMLLRSKIPQNYLEVVDLKYSGNNNCWLDIELATAHSSYAYISPKSFKGFEDKVHSLRLGDQLSPLMPIKYEDNRLYLGPIVPAELAGLNVTARLTKIVSSIEKRAFLIFAIAPDTVGTINSFHGADYITRFGDFNEGDEIVLRAVEKTMHNGLVNWILAHPLFGMQPQIGTVYQGWVYSDYFEAAKGFKVDFFPGCRSGILKVAPEFANQVRSGCCHVRLVDSYTNARGDKCYVLEDSFIEARETFWSTRPDYCFSLKLF
jgi:HrpA-like RNA helicase